MLTQHDLTQHIKAASNLMKQQRIDEALAELKPLEGDEFAMQSEVFIGLLASLYATIKMFDRARSLYEQLLALNPENWLAKFQLGKTYFDQQDWPAAKRELLPVAEQPGEYVASLHMGLIARMEGEPEQATKWLTQAQQNCPNEHALAGIIAEQLKELG